MNSLFRCIRNFWVHLGQKQENHRLINITRSLGRSTHVTLIQTLSMTIGDGMSANRDIKLPCSSVYSSA